VFYICEYIYIIYIIMFVLLSSSYLLMFGDDRVCGTSEQTMLMQVVLVRLSHGARVSWEAFIFMIWNICKNLWDTFILFPVFIIFGFWLIIGSNKRFKFSVFFGKWGIIKWSWFNVSLFYLFRSLISWQDVTTSNRKGNQFILDCIFKLVF